MTPRITKQFLMGYLYALEEINTLKKMKKYKRRNKNGKHKTRRNEDRRSST
jgi:hypothetical protein